MSSQLQRRRGSRQLHLLLAFGLATLASTYSTRAPGQDEPASLNIGETFTVESKALGETRRINVYRPPGNSSASGVRLPVLYMPDGGIGEDFLHIAGLIQISVSNSTMRPFLLVGIENTERRRDMTGPTHNTEDRKIAPRVGGSQTFRRFIRQELMPLVRARYHTTEESAIIGESLAGLFVIDTLAQEPDLFDTYIAVDPSLWWNNEALVKTAAQWLLTVPRRNRTLYFATSDEKGIVAPAQRLAHALSAKPSITLRWHYEPMPAEQHATIYHPAALRAIRALFAPCASGSTMKPHAPNASEVDAGVAITPCSQ